MIFCISESIHIIHNIIFEFKISSLVGRFRAAWRARAARIFEANFLYGRRAIWRAALKKIVIFSTWKKLLFVKNNFFFDIYYSESFMNVNYG